ncbi:MAG: T9SS type A sorting domain-containing protein [Bacteroidales bacterium]|nr:T9SS type A sorting domain-containing protein [Bacteroidales bacterium]
MKTTVKTAILIAALAASMALTAQRGPCFRNGGGYYSENLKNMLQLTDDQAVKFEAVRDDFFNARAEIFEDENLTVSDRREKMQQLRDNMDASMKDILDETQFTLWLGHREYSPGQRMGKNGKPRGGWMASPPQEVIELRKGFDAELSEDEKKLIAEVRETMQQNREEWGNGGFCRGQGNGAGPGTCMLPLQGIVENHQARLESIQDEIGGFIAARCPRGVNPEERGFRGRHKGFRNHKIDFEQRRMMHFLLLDTENLSGNMGATDDVSLILFPNPVADNLSIQFDNPSVGMVTVELLDKNGKVLRVIDESNRQAGGQTVMFNTGNLPSGDIYLIRVSGAEFSLTKKFVVQ